MVLSVRVLVPLLFFTFCHDFIEKLLLMVLFLSYPGVNVSQEPDSSAASGTLLSSSITALPPKPTDKTKTEKVSEKKGKRDCVAYSVGAPHEEALPLLHIWPLSPHLPLAVTLHSFSSVISLASLTFSHHPRQSLCLWPRTADGTRTFIM